MSKENNDKNAFFFILIVHQNDTYIGGQITHSDGEGPVDGVWTTICTDSIAIS